MGSRDAREEYWRRWKELYVGIRQARPNVGHTAIARLDQMGLVRMVVGSTLVVQPAAHMPVYAKQNGAFLAIITLSETPCDDLCDVLIQEKAGRVLQEIVKTVESGG